MPSAVHTSILAYTPGSSATPPHVEFTVSVNGLEADVDCTGSYGTSTAIVSGTVDYGDGYTATTVTSSHTYAAAGTYTITYTATQQDGQTASTSQSVTVTAPVAQGYDWSDSNLPWAYSSTNTFTATWPAGYTVVNIQTGSSDFYTNLQNTVAAAGKRVVVRLGAGTYHLDSFVQTAGGVNFSYGFFFSNLQGLLGQGPDKTFVQMDTNSMSGPQLSYLQSMKQADFAPNQMGLCRIDSKPSSPLLLGGLTFQSADQQNITSTGDTFSPTIALPQSAPHQGVVMYTDTVGTEGYVSYVRFQGAGRALNSQPPFEMANATSQHMKVYWNNVELDGRRAASIDSNRSRRCGVWMGNNETVSQMTDVWMHHSNLSRYAANDQNGGGNGGSSASYGNGTYIVTRGKFEQITNTNNDGNGGYTNATPLGWESSCADITLTNCIISRDNPYGGGQYPAHLQLTDVGGIHRDGGVFKVIDCEFRDSVYPTMSGYLIFRVSTSATYWYNGGNYNQLSIKKNGTTLTAVNLGSYNNPRSLTPAQAAQYSPNTHYFIENA